MDKKLCLMEMVGLFLLITAQLGLAQENQSSSQAAFNAFKSNINSILILILIIAVLVLIGKLFSVKENGTILWIIISVGIILVLAVILTDVI